MAAYLPIGGTRNATWAPTIELFYSGAAPDFTDAVASMQWRLYEGAADLVIDLSSVVYEDEPAPSADDPDRRLFRALPRIEPVTLRALPGLNEPEAGNPQTFHYDLIVTYGDGFIERYAFGPITLAPGVTAYA